MEISAKSLKDNIAINSVRVYNFAERKLIIVHITNGYSNKLEEKKNPKINFKKERNFAFFLSDLCMTETDMTFLFWNKS